MGYSKEWCKTFSIFIFLVVARTNVYSDCIVCELYSPRMGLSVLLFSALAGTSMITVSSCMVILKWTLLHQERKAKILGICKYSHDFSQQYSKYTIHLSFITFFSPECSFQYHSIVVFPSVIRILVPHSFMLPLGFQQLILSQCA